MKLWLISQTEYLDYDTYDAAIVAAETEEDARQTHPSGPEDPEDWKYDWASSPDNVVAKLIGTAIEGTEAGVICASFNAG